MNDKPQPLETFKCGNLDFAMWNNQGDDLRTFQSISIKRTYMDANGKWQDGGEIRLLPQQLNDIILGSQEMYRFWRLGMRQKKQQQAVPESQVHRPDTEQPAGLKPEESARPPNDSKVPGQAGLVGVESGSTEGFAEKVNQSRGSRRSR